MLARAVINFLVSSKLLPYICNTFCIFWSEVSNSFIASAVKNLVIKFVLYKSILSDKEFNFVK